MDPLDVLGVRAEVRGVVDFILEEDAGDFVADDVWGFDGVGSGVEVVFLQGAGCDG